MSIASLPQLIKYLNKRLNDIELAGHSDKFRDVVDEFTHLISLIRIPVEVQYRNFRLNFDTFKLRKNDKSLKMLPQECKILYLLFSNPGVCFSAKDIANEIDIPAVTNTIQVYMTSIRKKIGKKAIITVRGRGYYVPK